MQRVAVVVDLHLDVGGDTDGVEEDAAEEARDVERRAERCVPIPCREGVFRVYIGVFRGV